MNQQLENLMYQSGLTAQGCWDSMDAYDHTAIETLCEMIVRECAQVCATMPPLGPYKDVQVATLEDARTLILEHFGVEA